MEIKTKKALIKYSKPTRSLGLSAFFIAMSPIFYYFTLLDYQIFWVLSLAFLLAGISHIIFYAVITVKLNKRISEIEKSGNLPVLLNDFLTGGKAFNDNMILGESYIIGKNQGTIISYREIVNAYQLIHRTNGIENMRLLIAVDKNGKENCICKLKRFGDDNNETAYFNEYLLSRNPAIEIGFHGESKDNIIKNFIYSLRG